MITRLEVVFPPSVMLIIYTPLSREATSNVHASSGFTFLLSSNFPSTVRISTVALAATRVNSKLTISVAGFGYTTV